MNFPDAIRRSGLTIYNAIQTGDPLYIPTNRLETILNEGLRGFSTRGLPNRTRSKVVKSRVCEILGYPVPSSFRKTYPRFPGQDFDTYIQANDNLQVWNQSLSPTQRYVLIREQNGCVTNVRVVEGSVLSGLAKTGTLTQKYQARLLNPNGVELVSSLDTAPLHQYAKSEYKQLSNLPTDAPDTVTILTISALFSRLKKLVGQIFIDCGWNQERNRGAALHRLICMHLGYSQYADSGQFPDIKHQLLEIKLQTAATIDLGLVTPDSTAPLAGVTLGSNQIRNCDVRYAVFSATTDGKVVRLTGLSLTTGRDFFTRFSRCEGNVVNRKLQITLPRGFL